MQFDLPLTGLNGCGVGFVIQSLFPSEFRLHCHINLVLTTNIRSHPRESGDLVEKKSHPRESGDLVEKGVIPAKAGILLRKESSSRKRGSCQVW
jgi:hypothetical protein